MKSVVKHRKIVKDKVIIRRFTVNGECIAWCKVYESGVVEVWYKPWGSTSFGFYKEEFDSNKFIEVLTKNGMPMWLATKILKLVLKELKELTKPTIQAQ